MNISENEMNSFPTRGILITRSTAHCVSWIIQDYYSTVLNVEKSFCSDIFRVPTFSNCLFYLSVKYDKNDNNFRLNVNKLINNRSAFHSKVSSVSISLILIDESIGLHQKEDFSMNKDDTLKTVCFKKFDENCYHSLFKNVLEVQCTVSIEISKSSASSIEILKSQKAVNCSKLMSSQELQQHLDVLLEGEKDSRVVLHVNGQTFNAHKTMLCSHSSVFDAMFQHQTLEKLSNEIYIDDIIPEAMSEILRFIYFGASSGMSVEQAVDVYVASDKYNILKLRNISSNILKKNLTKDNVLEILKLADRHADEELEQVSVQFLMKNSSIIEEDIFLIFLKNECELARRIMLSILKMTPK